MHYQLGLEMIQLKQNLLQRSYPQLLDAVTEQNPEVSQVLFWQILYMQYQYEHPVSEKKIIFLTRIKFYV